MYQEVTLTVKQLIERLSQLPPDMKVCGLHDDWSDPCPFYVGEAEVVSLNQDGWIDDEDEESEEAGEKEQVVLLQSKMVR